MTSTQQYNHTINQGFDHELDSSSHYTLSSSYFKDHFFSGDFNKENSDQIIIISDRFYQLYSESLESSDQTDQFFKYLEENGPSIELNEDEELSIRTLNGIAHQLNSQVIKDTESLEVHQAAHSNPLNDYSDNIDDESDQYGSVLKGTIEEDKVSVYEPNVRRGIKRKVAHSNQDKPTSRLCSSSKKNTKEYMKPKHRFDAKEVVDKYLFGDISVFEERDEAGQRVKMSTEFSALFNYLRHECLDAIVDILSVGNTTRSDAKSTFFFRKINKIPLILLQYYGSKTQYKDKGLEIPLIAYIESFRKCFMPLFHSEDESNILELFLGFISTSLPAKRVKKILENFRDSKVISEELHLLCISLSETSRGTSKMDFQYTFENNLAFRTMVNQLPMILNKGMLQFNQVAFKKLLKKISK
jgi:hypothetical protein